MKKLLFIIALMCLLQISSPMVLALTPTPAATSTPTGAPKQTSILEQINNLKDKIASKVAELNLVEKRGLIGTVTEVTSTQLTINDVQDQTRFIDVDEITKFTSDSSKSGTFGISDITKGSVVTILGLYNKDSRRLLARFVDVGPLPVYASGNVSDSDKINYTVTVKTSDQKTILADIENTTKTLSYTNGATDFIKAGFSKLTIGEKVIVMGTPDKKEKDRITATKILLFPDLATAQAAPATNQSTTTNASTSGKNSQLIR